MFSILNIFEYVTIVGLGMFMHLYGLSIIELRYSKLPSLKPNLASSLFVLSVLCMLTKIRTFWPQSCRMPQRFMIFLLELSLILYASDFILSHLWLPSLKLLNFLCHFFGQYVITANQNFLIYNAPQLANFIRNDVFYLMRFLFAVITFILMLKITDCVKNLQQKYLMVADNTKQGDLTYVDDLYNEDYNCGNVTTSQNIHITRNVRPFDVDELPRVPPEDILSLSNRSNLFKQKKSKIVRKNKRKSNILLDEDLSEYNC